MLAENVRWFDDWFALQDVASGVIAIGEPRFHQVNWNYLIAGSRRALLFDTGPGVRDISRVVRALTNLPVTALPSHLHFDHTGGLDRFSSIAMADLPVLRGMEREGWFHASDELFRGFREGMVWKPVKVSQWIPIGGVIDLGGRRLEVLHTPGHSTDSISLLDEGANLLFAADFVYPGPLYAQIPGADLAEYLGSARSLPERLKDNVRILCAHGDPADPAGHQAPVLFKQDVEDLRQCLERLRQSGERLPEVQVNSRMSLKLWEPAFASWQST